MSPRARKSFLNFIASGLLSLFGSRHIEHTTEDLKKGDFNTSTQRLGVRFTEKIRDVFRFRWIRKNDSPD
jgi:hypothetical protein